MEIKKPASEIENTEIIRQERQSKGAIKQLQSAEAKKSEAGVVDQVNLETSKAILEIMNDEPKKDLEAIKRKYAGGALPADLAEKIAGGLDEQVSILKILDEDPSKAA